MNITIYAASRRREGWGDTSPVEQVQCETRERYRAQLREGHGLYLVYFIVLSYVRHENPKALCIASRSFVFVAFSSADRA